MLQNPFTLLKETSISNKLESRDGVVEVHDPLSIDIEDDELVKIVEKRHESYRKLFDGEKYQLSARREKNEMYLMGRQIASNEKESKLRRYEARYQDNVLWEIEQSIEPVAMSRMPDMIALPGSESQESNETAKQVSIIVDSDIKKRENRTVLSMAIKQLPVYFTAFIKCQWNPQLGIDGDYEFVNVHPDNMFFDEQCPINDTDKMDILGEFKKVSVQEVCMRFPESKEAFLEQLKKDGIMKETDKEWKNMATTVKIVEVWFTWYKKKTDSEYERIEGVLWKYGKIILKKMRNPNYDYEGKQKYFTYDIPGDKTTKREVNSNELMASAFTGQIPQNIQPEMVYRNYFTQPRKPYYMFGFDQWGKVAIDETSRIEQNIYNQENIDNVGKRVIEKLRDRGKHVFSKESGLTGKDIERMDLNNPDQDLLIDGNVNNAHGYIPPIQPTPQEFNQLNLSRSNMTSLAGAQNLNGALQSDTATSNQIAREANFTRVDFWTEKTINAAAEWMAQWSLHMIKLRYTEEHMRVLLGGANGSATFAKIKGDMIEDGMEVKIKASGTDKIKRQQNAIEMAKMKMIDPLTFCQDMDLSDPEGRAEKMIMFNMDPAGYYMKFIKKMEVPQMAGALTGGAVGQIPTPQGQPQQPSPQNTAQVPINPSQVVQASPNSL